MSYKPSFALNKWQKTCRRLTSWQLPGGPSMMSKTDTSMVLKLYLRKMKMQRHGSSTFFAFNESYFHLDWKPFRRQSRYNRVCLSTLFRTENEWQKTKLVPIPLPRASRNFPDVKTRNNFFSIIGHRR